MPEYCGLLQIEPQDGIVTVDGTITTNANPIQAGQGPANSNAWVGATNGETGDQMKWAQIGYLWRRSAAGEMACNVYVEVQAGPNDDTDYFVKYFAAPSAGAHRYSAVLDEFTGTWTFFFDKSYLAGFKHAGWKDITARKTQFTCEIQGEGARVLGTDESPCSFNGCEYEIATTDPKHPEIISPDFNDGDAWNVLDEVQGGGVGSVMVDPLGTGRFSTSRDVDVDLSRARSAGAVDRGGRPQAESSRIPAPAASVAPAVTAEALRDAHARLVATVSGGALAGDGVVLSGVDPDDGSLLVVVEAERFRNVGQLQRRLREEIGEIPVRLVPGRVEEQNGGAGNQTIRPLQGGTQISSSAGKATLGVCAYRAQTGKLGFLTAGHTVGGEHDLVGQADKDNLAGQVTLNAYANHIDIAWVDILMGIKATPFLVWTSSGGYTITKILSDDPEKGWDCSMQGAQSGSQAGKISKFINMTAHKGEHAVNGVTMATYASVGGDSGGPVVVFGTGNAVLLLGIHNGRATVEDVDYAYFTQASTFHRLVELSGKGS
jgi:hypothetical protein